MEEVRQNKGAECLGGGAAQTDGLNAKTLCCDPREVLSLHTFSKANHI